jgi:hypothetical protein
LKIVSGGQTGVDTAALNFARDHDLPYGGWVPKGRTNEAGVIPSYFLGLTEATTADVNERTRLNVKFSDATLVFINGSPSPGTDQTVRFAQEADKPYLVTDLRIGAITCAQDVGNWLKQHPISTLNIAGPRASEAPGLGTDVSEVLRLLLDLLQQ